MTEKKVQQRTVKVWDKVTISNRLPFTLIAGPCALESREHAMEMAHALTELTKKLHIPFIYKTSFDKANRMSGHKPRGIGMKAGLPILAEVREKYGCPVITDVHSAEQCKPVAEVVDVLQTPAFLCRQTDLLLAAGETGKPIHIKKGQFLAPWDMANVAKKVASTGNENIMLCERGVSFGYNMLISDMRSLPIMESTGYPVIYDASHSVQQPGGLGDASGGQREFIPMLARAAMAVGVAGVFIETHHDPDKAPSDGPTMLYFKDMPGLLMELKEFDALAKKIKA